MQRIFPGARPAVGGRAASGVAAPQGQGPDGALTCHFEWDLKEEHRALKENQKICQSKAQKYLIETNRRIRAFEEKQKQEEEKTQRFREQVLQQRKNKLQKVTDKFQRAHLPFSQHKQMGLKVKSDTYDKIGKREKKNPQHFFSYKLLCELCHYIMVTVSTLPAWDIVASWIFSTFFTAVCLLLTVLCFHSWV
uniref:Centrosomal protein 126 n=1 Tax=Falco tinnunculus TaxID=100819 RepID=A0A8C4XQQ6_FALTI